MIVIDDGLPIGAAWVYIAPVDGKLHNRIPTYANSAPPAGQHPTARSTYRLAIAFRTAAPARASRRKALASLRDGVGFGIRFPTRDQAALGDDTRDEQPSAVQVSRALRWA
jgi:hypothetical protein